MGYLVALGRLYVVAKDQAKARASFEKVMELDPNNQQAVFDLARLEAVQGSLDEAVKRLEALRQKNPTHLGLAMYLAGVYERQENWQKAKEVYEAVLVQRREVWTAANNLAFILADREPKPENLDRARNLMAPLLRDQGEVPEVVDTWAWIKYREGDYAKAKELLAGIQEKAGNNPAFNYHLGMVQLGLGDKAGARTLLEKALTPGQAFPGKAEAQKALVSLR
jgi:tetratricopeptide (TPR) repeat protein